MGKSLSFLAILLIGIGIFSGLQAGLFTQSTHPTQTKGEPFAVTKSDAEWQKQLSPEEYNVLRKEGTEPAFTGKYTHNKETGNYHCKACEHPLFSSTTKFDSGTGWPSFMAPLTDGVGTRDDSRFGMKRTEVHCKNCGSHLGHVFDDGPGETGLRYCINSVSLNFDSEIEN